MRWTDKPRKKTRREIVLEYIKFLKIMGYYDKLVTYMYRVARYDGSYMYIKGQYREAKVLCHKQCMISYFETELRNHNRNAKLIEWVVRDYFIRYPLGMNINDGYDLTQLLFSYFKDKHIDNCIIVDN
jgi:hypothetical protein